MAAKFGYYHGELCRVLSYSEFYNEATIRLSNGKQLTVKLDELVLE